MLEGIDNQMFGKMTPAMIDAAKRTDEDMTGIDWPPFDITTKWPWGIYRPKRLVVRNGEAVSK